MSNTTEVPPAFSESKRRAGLAYFLIRLLKEEPLGTACGIIVLLTVLCVHYS